MASFLSRFQGCVLAFPRLICTFGSFCFSNLLFLLISIKTDRSISKQDMGLVLSYLFIEIRKRIEEKMGLKSARSQRHYFFEYSTSVVVVVYYINIKWLVSKFWGCLAAACSIFILNFEVFFLYVLFVFC